jgi:glutathione S-transferase
MPYLEIDNMCLHQSMAICRYLARKYGIAGKTEADIVQADMMAETVNDARGGL